MKNDVKAAPAEPCADENKPWPFAVALSGDAFGDTLAPSGDAKKDQKVEPI